MSVPRKHHWTVTASSGDPRGAVDDLYATAWIADAATSPWLTIDLGAVACLGGIEVYWGRHWATAYRLEQSSDGLTWAFLCRTRHGEGDQDVFAFSPVDARFVRLACDDAPNDRGIEIVEINVYAPSEAASVRENGRVAVLGGHPITLPAGDSVTVDLGSMRFPLGVFIEWGETYGTVFSVHLSDNGADFREVGRIATGDGGSDTFWWRSTTARYVRLTVHEATAQAGAVINELKLRVLNKDRMPIGQLERAAANGRGELYPQSLLGRQVYWTALGEFDQAEQALFDEYGNLEPRRGSPQITPLLRVRGGLHGAPGSTEIHHSLADGSLPVPTVVWSVQNLELSTTALAHHGQAIVEYRVTNNGSARIEGALLLAVRPVQINPYWQHGGHAPISAIAAGVDRLHVNNQPFVAFSPAPDVVTIADFDHGDVVRLIETESIETTDSLRSGSGLLSAASEFPFALAPGAEISVVASASMRDELTPDAIGDFGTMRDSVVHRWRRKLGPRRITVGDPEISETLEAQTALILVNATKFAFKPGPRNYDRTWVRDGSSQALALLWAGLIEEAKAYVIWYATRVDASGLVPPILNVDGSINRGYGSNIEFDAQGEFVGIVADVYRVSKDCTFLRSVFETTVRAVRFIEELCARTDALYGPDTRFSGLLSPSISHEGYNKPSFSYWDDFFALSAWRNCQWLALELGELGVAAEARVKGDAFAAALTRSICMTAEVMGRGIVPASADRDDVDPTSTAIAFEPCRVEDVLPAELLPATFDIVADLTRNVLSLAFAGNYTPYVIRNLNAFVGLGRLDDAFSLLSMVLADRRPRGWRSWAEVVWSDSRAPEYLGDMPHTWIGAEFSTAVRRMLVREDEGTLELFHAVPAAWWEGEGITLRELPTKFGALNLTARRGPSKVTIEMSLTGPAPERISVRVPDAKRAVADGRLSAIDGDVIATSTFRHLVVDLAEADF